MDPAPARARGAIGRARDARLHEHFGTLLALLLAIFVVNGFSEFLWARATAGVLQICMIFVAFFSTRRDHRVSIAAASCALVITALGITVMVEGTGESAHGVAALLVATVFVVLLGVVARRVLRRPVVDLETLYGALCVYFLIGMLFSDLYIAVDAFALDPIFGRVVPREDYSYFSFVTLTTLGYGDIVATSDVARRFAVVEAMAGQIFLATVVARLVSLYGAGRTDRAEGPASPPVPDSGDLPAQ